MDKLTDNIKNIALIGLLLIAIVFGVIQTYKLKKSESMAAMAAIKTQKTVSQAATIINRYIDTSGRNHVVISADSNRLTTNWYKDGTAISGGLVDTVARALNIAKKQLQEITQIANTTQADKLKALKKYDSLQRITYFYKDKYLQLAYRPALPGDTIDNGQFDFKYNDSLNVVQYWKKKWFMGAKKSYIDIFSNDPRTTINGVKRLVVQQEEPSFGLRIQAVGVYGFDAKKINVGPGVQFDFKRFSLTGTYYYDTDFSRWRPTVGARYDIIRF